MASFAHSFGLILSGAGTAATAESKDRYRESGILSLAPLLEAHSKAETTADTSAKDSLPKEFVLTRCSPVLYSRPWHAELLCRFSCSPRLSPSHKTPHPAGAPLKINTSR